ncbi:MAG: MFS transporter [Candidatus Binatia bacterium]
MTRLQRRWVILVGCFLAWFMLGGVQTYTLFIAAWSTEFGWSITALSFAASVQLAVNGLFAPIGGKLADRFGTKWVLVAYIAALGGGALAVGRMTSLWQLVVIQGVVFGMASGLGPILSPLLARWFVERRGLAFAMAPAGHHLGRGAFAPVVVALTAMAGWRTPWLLMGALILLVPLPFILLTFRDSPSPENVDSGKLSHAASQGHGTNEGAPVGEALHTSPFWLILAGFLACGSTAQPIVIHLAPMAWEGGLGQTEAATALMLFGVMAVFGLLSSGVATDWLGGSKTLVVYYLSRGVGFIFLLLFLSWRDPWLLYLGVGIIGFFGRGTDPAVRTLLANCFGVRSLGTLVGLVLMIHQLASAFWIFLGGFLFQRTGTYSGFLIASAVILLGASIVSWYIHERRCYTPAEATV